MSVKNVKDISPVNKCEILGCIDQIEDGFITGWACTAKFEVVDIDFYYNDSCFAKIKANMYREDLLANSIGNGMHAFKVAIPRTLFENSKFNVVAIIWFNNEKCKKLVKEFFLDGINSVVKQIKNDEKTRNFLESDKKSSEIQGKISLCAGGTVTGWLGSETLEVIPYITVNEKPCLLLSYNDNLNNDQKTSLTDMKFEAKLPDIDFDNLDIKLYAISLKGITFIHSKPILAGNVSPDSISAIFKALVIAKQKKSVGIVVWEGTHNPIGRAQVLFNILNANNRPAVIITYDIGFSSSPIWQPLINSDCKVLILPWKDREIYNQLFKNIGLNFDLVWICKPRFPSFVLAESISHDDTKYIVDLDDNEKEMSSSAAARDKPYGLLSAKMANNYLSRLPVRSVASKSLEIDFKGLLVRHARALNSVKRVRQTDLTKEIRIGFIGTVRPHKGVVKAAKAINELNKRKGTKFKFVVGGVYEPTTIRSELIKLGCEVHGNIDSSRLQIHLQNLDVIITGFPDVNANKEILKYQISSKIGDALSNQRTVLVPEGPSVNDLAGTPSIYLFNNFNFDRILLLAAEQSSKVELDEQFTLGWNYQQFLKLEKLTEDISPKGKSLFNLDKVKKVNKYKKVSSGRNVILIWKQHDSNLYGRRVDHLARSLVASGVRVTCLELISDGQFASYEKNSLRVDTDARYIVDDFRQKRKGFESHGIYYKTMLADCTQTIKTAIKHFLIEENLYPVNSSVVMFPAVPDWKVVSECFSGYRVTCDIVDNQLAWEKKKPLELLAQYKYIIDLSNHVVFNSEENCNFFTNAGYLDEKNVSILPNWYCLPPGYTPPKREVISNDLAYTSERPFKVVYSGNMNDRFDWDTVSRLSKEIDTPLEVHLIGNCQRQLDKMCILLDDASIIYHGPMRERELLVFMEGCDLAIMPHITDEHSSFMNPMKVNMYKAIGLYCVASTMPGVEFSNDLIEGAETSDEFVYKVKQFAEFNIDKSNCQFASEKKDESSIKYLKLLE
ncbi:hypothetical protein [Psychromonas aquatilis]|uniref:Glycosyltransferase involved in cell wall biosynthesis n=1 Tax=Psychromonas aquatilis TaxID=2005072 RepID=A0ABU9GTQ1_9GAMM